MHERDGWVRPDGEHTQPMMVVNGISMWHSGPENIRDTGCFKRLKIVFSIQGKV